MNENVCVCLNKNMCNVGKRVCTIVWICGCMWCDVCVCGYDGNVWMRRERMEWLMWYKRGECGWADGEVCTLWCKGDVK